MTSGSTQRAKLIEKVRARVGLGRREAKDPRDALYPLRAALPPARAIAALPESKYWSPGAVLDQGPTPQCVAYSWTQFLLTSPIKSKLSVLGSDFMQRVYREAQTVDEWPGEAYDGTSVRAGAKVLTRLGHLAEYRWAKNADEVKTYVLSRGCVIFGTNWYEGMFYPTHDGYLKIEGQIAGGHAYAIVGYSKPRDAFRILNSWGIGWGEKGRAWIKRTDAQILLDQDGEACSGLQQLIKAA